MLSNICGPGAFGSPEVPTGPLTRSSIVPPSRRIGRIVEAKPPEAGLARPVLARQRAERGRGHEVEVGRIVRIPGAVLGALEVRHTAGLAVRFEQWPALPGMRGDVDDLEAERVADLPVGLLILGLWNAEHLEAVEVAVP